MDIYNCQTPSIQRALNLCHA